MKLSFQGEGEELTTRLVREKTNGVMEGRQEKTVMQLMEGERGIVLEGIKRGAGEVDYRYDYDCGKDNWFAIIFFRSAGIGVEDETIVDFGLEWMDKLADEPVDDMDDDNDDEDAGMEDDSMEVNDAEGVEMEEDMEDLVQDLLTMFGLGEFVDLIKTFLAGDIRDDS